MSNITGQSEQQRSDYSISAFYDPMTKARGREVCDALALDRSVSHETRELARRNLWFYARKLNQLAPTFHAKQIGVVPEEGWLAMNPSIAWIGDRLMCVIRTVNYTISPEGRYLMPEGDPVIRTRNWLAELNPDLSVRSAAEMLPPDCWPETPAYREVIGFEDMRLYEAEGRACFSATVRELYADGACRQVHGSIIGNRVVYPEVLGGSLERYEKNWMPVSGRLGCFLYGSDPVVVVEEGRHHVIKDHPSIAAENFRGGSQLIPFDDGWLCLIHEVPEFHRYVHRFVWFDSEFRLAKVSHQFRFRAERGIEFCAGMAWLDEGLLVISFGVGDAEAWLGKIVAEDVRRMLRALPPASPSQTCVGCGAAQDGTETGIGEREKVNQTTKRSGAKAFLRDAGPWADAQTNRALLTDADVGQACDFVAKHNLPLHPDRPKNWDTVIGLVHVLRHTKSNERILDAGAGRESAFLPALARLKYRHLDGVNLLFGQPLRVDGVHYGPGDITKLDYSDETFAFVFCQSVIEHDVDTAKFFKEMARILKPGGRLLVSTDYWPEPMTAANRIYDGTGIEALRREAREAGLEDASADLASSERVVTHCGASYTFLNLLFRRSD